MARCPECGTRVRDRELACPACGYDPRDDVVVLDLEAEGSRGSTPGVDQRAYEERFADLGAGLGTVPRRVHGEGRERHPAGVLLTVVVALLVMSALATRPPDQGSARIPVLTERTRTRLLLVRIGAPLVLDVDRRRTRPAGVGPLPVAQFTAVVGRGGGFVFLLGDNAYAVRLSPAAAPVLLGPATQLLAAADPRRVWLLSYPGPGITDAREADLDGRTTAGPLRFQGTSVLAALTGGRFIAQPPDASGHTTLAIVSATAAPRPLARDALLIAARPDLVVYRATGCDRCPIVLVDPVTGRQRPLGRAGAGVVAGVGSFSPDGRRLAIFGSSPRASGVRVEMVDLRDGSSKTAPAGSLTPSPTALAWSPSGEWLFFDAGTGRVEAVRSDGSRREVDVDVPPLDALVSLAASG